MRRGAALIAAALLLGGAGPMRLTCAVEPGADGASPDWGRAFSVGIPFGEGVGLALIDAETQAVIRMAYAADVLAGRFQAGSEDLPLTWTRATAARAPLVGLAIRGDGHLLTIVIDRAGAASAAGPSSGAITRQPLRAARVHDTRAQATWAAQCQPAAAD